MLCKDYVPRGVVTGGLIIPLLYVMTADLTARGTRKAQHPPASSDASDYTKIALMNSNVKIEGESRPARSMGAPEPNYLAAACVADEGGLLFPVPRRG